MALYYLDTSALAKRYVREVGSEWVDDICLRQSIVTSALTEVEIASTLARRGREGVLSTFQSDNLFRQYQTDEQGYAVVGLSPLVLLDAVELLMARLPNTHWRALDALHLASARTAFAEAAQHGQASANFFTFDRQLALAARSLGLSVPDSENSP